MVTETEPDVEIPDEWDKSAAELTESDRAYLKKKQEGDTDGSEPVTEPPADETELETPVKVRFTGDVRGKFVTRQIEPLAGTPEEQLSYDPEDVDRAGRTVKRQKTNLVARTEEELDAVIDIMDGFKSHAGHYGAMWGSTQKAQAVSRVVGELKDARDGLDA